MRILSRWLGSKTRNPATVTLEAVEAEYQTGNLSEAQYLEICDYLIDQPNPDVVEHSADDYYGGMDI